MAVIEGTIGSYRDLSIMTALRAIGTAAAFDGTPRGEDRSPGVRAII
jgi:hypothetical protein